MDPDEFKAPQSLEQALPSPDYVHGPEYPEYVAPTDDEIPEESFMDVDDEEEASEKDEEEHLALVESAALPTIDLVPSTKETEPFQTDESASTPPPPRSPQTRALIDEYASAPTPPSPPPSPLSPLSTSLPRIPSPPLSLPPLHTSPSYASAPLGYKAAMVYDIPETDMPFQKRLCLTALAFRFEVWETSTADVAGQIGEVNKRVTDLATTQRRDAHELYVVYARWAWSRSEDKSTALKALIRAHEARITALEAHTKALQRNVSVLQWQRINDGDILTMHIQHEHDRFKDLARTRDAER
uniref:Uncharacterized protein n=1 Tax=Tanacetum cinerariifolium TaxID=118510 RepID=A0A699JAE5_TANCI|nr:hypothetical protein [Tanacetum cinerariifolium]